MPKYLFISGSARRGNTDFILSQIYDSVGSSDEKEIIYLREKNIKHCIGCLSCHNQPFCVLPDDMKEILDKMINSKIIIIGTPNYFDNVSGLLKDFIDRTHPLYITSLLKGKKVVLVSLGGGEVEGTIKCLTDSMNGFINYQKLELIGSYGFQALNADELKKSDKLDLQIKLIIENIHAV